MRPAGLHRTRPVAVPRAASPGDPAYAGGDGTRTKRETMSQTPTPVRNLRDGSTVPAVGLGTWPLDDEDAEKAVAGALGIGYRLVDTALNYGNERGTGRGIARAGVPREELFVTTKVPVSTTATRRRWPRSRSPGATWDWSTSTCTSSTGRCPGSTGTWTPGRP